MAQYINQYNLIISLEIVWMIAENILKKNSRGPSTSGGPLACRLDNFFHKSIMVDMINTVSIKSTEFFEYLSYWSNEDYAPRSWFLFGIWKGVLQI
jgi:hypothetical protein